MIGNSERPETRIASERSYKRHSGQKEDTVNTDQEETVGRKKRTLKGNQEASSFQHLACFQGNKGKKTRLPF